jgi:hypothetical protein
MMRTYYEKVLNRMRRPVLLVAVAIVALLSVSGVAMAVTSTDEGRNEGRAVKVAASDVSTMAASPTSTAFRSVSIPIPSGSGTKQIASSVTFDSNVKSAAVVLNGFNLDYSSSDHHINVIEADVDFVRISGRTVFIKADTQYADQNFDDSYTGWVSAVVIANVE